MSQWGLRMTCEAKQRKKIKTILPFDFLAEDAMFTFTQKKGGKEIPLSKFLICVASGNGCWSQMTGKAHIL